VVKKRVVLVKEEVALATVAIEETGAMTVAMTAEAVEAEVTTAVVAVKVDKVMVAVDVAKRIGNLQLAIRNRTKTKQFFIIKLNDDVPSGSATIGLLFRRLADIFNVQHNNQQSTSSLYVH
jgi:hypothetical protein